MKNKGHIGVENVVRKGEIAYTSNFSFSYNVFHSYTSLVRQNVNCMVMA